MVKTVKIKVRNLSKVFGAHPKKALEMRNQGMKRPDIFEKTGQTCTYHIADPRMQALIGALETHYCKKEE